MKSLKIILFFVLVFMMSITGCTNNQNVDESIIEKAKILEINEYQLTMLQISYDEFKENMKDIVVDINYLDDKEIFGYMGVDGNRIYLAKDLAGLTLEEIELLNNEFEEEMRKQFEEKGLDYETESEYGKWSIEEIKLSGVYDYSDQNWKYLFSQTLIKYNDNNNTEMLTNKRYRFVEDAGEWKILDVEQSFVSWNDRNITMKDEVINKLKYQTYNNDPVEYIEVFNFGD